MTAAKLIGKNDVVTMHYTVRDSQKAVLDSSEGQEPLLYLHGHGQIIPGLEQALVGKTEGQKLEVIIEPKDGYGDYDARLKQTIDKNKFPPKAKLEVGEMFELAAPKGESLIARITEVNGDQIVLDANHPLAGKQLHFAVEIVSVRDATKEELEHGHAHPGDGHHH